MSPSLALSLFVIGAGLALFGQIMVLRDAFAGRTPAATSGQAARLREALWIMIPAVALALTLWATWRVMPQEARPVTQEPGPVAVAAARTNP